MGFFNIGKLFSYKSPKPLEKEQIRRFELAGKTNKELNKILKKRPHLHVKKQILIDMIIQKEFYTNASDHIYNR